jgi:valyl-tRNA synthetase
MPSGISKLGTVYMSIEGLIDVETELKKIQGELELIEGHLKGVQAKLANSNFVDRAPKEVVAVQEAKEIELKEKREKLEQNIAMFKKV